MHWFALGSPLRVYVEEPAACAGWIFEDDFDCRFYLGLDDFGFGWIAEGKVEFICGGGYEPSDCVCHVAPDRYVRSHGLVQGNVVWRYDEARHFVYFVDVCRGRLGRRRGEHGR